MRDHGNAYITYHMVHSEVLPKKGFPVVFHGVRGNGERTKSSPSYFNVVEASIIRNYCVTLIEDPERKICEHASISIPPPFSLPWHRSGGDWRSCTPQGPDQGHSGVVEGGEVVKYFGGICRGVSGTGVAKSPIDDADTYLSSNQERKVIILATNRYDEESHSQKSLGLLVSRQRVNG